MVAMPSNRFMHMKNLSFHRHILPSVLGAAGIFGMAPSASGVLYTADFETDPTANWASNIGPATTDAAADFFFDYSTAGIASAPSGTGTRGLKLQANQSSGVFGGISVSPVGLALPAEYILTFDWWANFNGPAPSGGSGSTQLSTFGVATSGTVSQWPGGTTDSVWFAGSVDGNSASDWRAYSSAAPTSYTAASGVYAAGTGTSPDARNNSHPYYSSFGGIAAPAAQVALYPQQTGLTLVGSPAFEWHAVEIAKTATAITWTVDGLLIATIDPSTVTLGGNNIFFGHADTNATSSTDVNDIHLLFTLIDNVQVIVPEPGTVSLLGLLGAALGLRRRK